MTPSQRFRRLDLERFGVHFRDKPPTDGRGRSAWCGRRRPDAPQSPAPRMTYSPSGPCDDGLTATIAEVRAAARRAGRR